MGRLAKPMLRETARRFDPFTLRVKKRMIWVVSIFFAFWLLNRILDWSTGK